MFAKATLSLLGYACMSALADDVESSSSRLVPNSCNDLEDGTYMMKLIDDEDYPLVSIKCSNGYGILDYSLDSNIVDYFDTWYQWFPKTIGPTNEAHVNWQEWFLPHVDADSDDEDMPLTKYALSPDCSSCEVTHKRQLHGLKTTYWMTGTIFGCFWAIKGNHNCDIDYDTNTCYTCDSARGMTFTAITDNSTEAEYLLTGICPHNVQSSDYYTPVYHDDCSESEDGDELYHLKPSIGIEGEHCVCFQQETTEYFSASEEEIAQYESNIELQLEAEEDEEPVDITVGDDKVVYLYQSDFAEGTYRIKESGMYVIMEDIVFDFNSNVDAPNQDRSYMPTSDQADDYPGAASYKGSYFLGFFAGITVEADNVIIELNDHTLKMSDYFYFQQRWFTTIELGTQYFLPGQGTGNFGGRPVTPSNIEIRNGKLGLTSHHGIHGNSNTNVILKNLHVYDFETHGIQFNGFDNIYMEGIEVGPTSGKVYFNGEYGHMRQLLVRYKEMADDLDQSYANGEITDDDYFIQFDGRDHKVTMRDIANQLELLMNIAFDYIVKKEPFEVMRENGALKGDEPITRDQFEEAIRLFVNTDTQLHPNAAAQYGIFLNTFGASVFTYNLKSNYYSTDATLIDIKIHGMRHSMKEYTHWREYNSKNIIVNPFGGPLSIYEVLQDTDDFSNPRYKGNIMTDAAIASNKFSNSFDMLALQVIKNDYMVPWATGEDLGAVTDNDINSIQIGCNSDVMIHSGKGINGLRLDGVENVYVKNIEVFDNVDSTPLGDTICGAYNDVIHNGQSAQWGGHFRQTVPMQSGFSGNMNQAINVNAAQNVVFENVYVHDIMSWTGPSFGISIWPSCDVELRGDITVNNLQAGATITEDMGYEYTSRPNKAPEVCGVRTYYSYDSYTTNLVDSDATYTIDEDTLNGLVGCFGTDTISMVSQDDFDSAVAAAVTLSSLTSDASDSSDVEGEEGDLGGDDGVSADTNDDIEFGHGDLVDDNTAIEFSHEMIKNNHSKSGFGNMSNSTYILTITFISFMVFGIAALVISWKRDRDGYIVIQDAK